MHLTVTSQLQSANGPLRMNDDEPTARLATLRAEHRLLDAEIALRLSRGDGDMLELARLKKRKLRLKDEIQLLLDATVPDIIA